MVAALDLPGPIVLGEPLPTVCRPVDFHRLLGGPAWRSLPFAVQRRFGPAAHLAPVRYAGAMQVRASRLGWLIAQACRLLGTPLAPWTGEDVPVAVDVHTDRKGALVWDRTYAFERHGLVKVTSRKVLGRKGELMEVIHGGLGMTLALTVEDGALHFRSTGYFLNLLGLRLPIPWPVTPGDAHVVHEDQGGGWFRFTLRFTHRLAGETFFQTGLFRDPGDLP
ncbi:DUF4166 domain-containing protein [Phenylobacterium sp.]|jgi:hypothetical protein|uniref:DUF4166 domain-containing protein n=1 Tax=Phenylobacterium sp. TaxID=1871053 RepID=UPI002F3F8D7F